MELGNGWSAKSVLNGIILEHSDSQKAFYISPEMFKFIMVYDAAAMNSNSSAVGHFDGVRIMGMKNRSMPDTLYEFRYPHGVFSFYGSYIRALDILRRSK